MPAQVEQVRLGATGVRVSRLVMGCAPLGGLFAPVSEQQARATVEEAWDVGVRTFDTAPHYGAGLSERRVGAALRERPRDELVLSTKVGRLLRPDAGEEDPAFAEPTGLRRVWDFSADGVRRSLEESLERLGLDRVDILLVHDPDEHLDAAIHEALPALARLRDEGLIRAVGAGMNAAAPLERIVREADVDCVLVAGRVTLLDQSAVPGLLPLCRERGVGVIAGGVFSSGILADPGPDARHDYAPAPEEVRRRVAAIAAVCDRHGVPLHTAALALPRQRDDVASVLVGARSPEEVRANLDAFESHVPADLWRDLVAEGLLAEAAAPV